MKKYFNPVMFSNELVAEQGNDGLLYRFETTKELKKDLTSITSYSKSDECWYFNSSHDRMCAEYDYRDKHIMINPNIVAKLYGLPVLFELN